MILINILFISAFLFFLTWKFLSKTFTTDNSVIQKACLTQLLDYFTKRYFMKLHKLQLEDLGDSIHWNKPNEKTKI